MIYILKILHRLLPNLHFKPQRALPVPSSKSCIHQSINQTKDISKPIKHTPYQNLENKARSYMAMAHCHQYATLSLQYPRPTKPTNPPVHKPIFLNSKPQKATPIQTNKNTHSNNHELSQYALVLRKEHGNNSKSTSGTCHPTYTTTNQTITRFALLCIAYKKWVESSNCSFTLSKRGDHERHAYFIVKTHEQISLCDPRYPSFV